MRKAYEKSADLITEYEAEKVKASPNRVKMVALRMDISSTMEPALLKLKEINESAQKTIKKDIFTISGTTPSSRRVREDFDKVGMEYTTSLSKRILASSGLVPKSKKDTPYEDRKYIKSFFLDEELRERILSRPERRPQQEWSDEKRKDSYGTKYLRARSERRGIQEPTEAEKTENKKKNSAQKSERPDKSQDGNETR